MLYFSSPLCLCEMEHLGCLGLSKQVLTNYIIIVVVVIL